VGLQFAVRKVLINEPQYCLLSPYNMTQQDALISINLFQ